MASIRESFRLILYSRNLTLKGFRELLWTDYHIHMSAWYLYYLLNHPEKLTVRYVRVFTRALSLSDGQQRNLFL